jgi:DNA-binding transcriptional ArsR family regulator
MVNSRQKQLDEALFALSDPTRRAMLTRLARGDCTVAELAEPFAVSLPAISKQLRVLERAGLVSQRREGRVRRCHFEAAPLREVSQWVLQYCHL